MKVNISHQQPEPIAHTVVERWQRHLKRSNKVSTQLDKVSKRLERFRIFTIILLIIFVVSLGEQSAYIGSLTKWAFIAALLIIFGYLFYTHQKIKRRKT
ncbi:MAG TPA: hypothetical protein EYG71_07915 [Leucothrix sp.]|nr:hypothetical protein [Leucothrix sp.]